MIRMKNLKKLQNLDDKYINKFRDMATKIVMDEVDNTDDENKKTIIMFTARDMAIGAILKKNEYILTGVGIGILGTLVTLKIINYKKKKDRA